MSLTTISLTMQLRTLALVFSMAVMMVQSVRTKACGPQTKVCTYDHTDAASNPAWECKSASSGVHQVITPAEKGKPSAKICGPGTFTFSPMSCPPPAAVGSNYNYKQKAYTVADTAVTTQCKVVDFPYDMACYHVDC